MTVFSCLLLGSALGTGENRSSRMHEYTDMPYFWMERDIEEFLYELLNGGTVMTRALMSVILLLLRSAFACLRILTFLMHLLVEGRWVVTLLCALAISAYAGSRVWRHLARSVEYKVAAGLQDMARWPTSLRLELPVPNLSRVRVGPVMLSQGLKGYGHAGLSGLCGHHVLSSLLDLVDQVIVVNGDPVGWHLGPDEGDEQRVFHAWFLQGDDRMRYGSDVPNFDNVPSFMRWLHDASARSVGLTTAVVVVSRTSTFLPEEYALLVQPGFADFVLCIDVTGDGGPSMVMNSALSDDPVSLVVIPGKIPGVYHRYQDGKHEVERVYGWAEARFCEVEGRVATIECVGANPLHQYYLVHRPYHDSLFQEHERLTWRKGFWAKEMDMGDDVCAYTSWVPEMAYLLVVGGRLLGFGVLDSLAVVHQEQMRLAGRWDIWGNPSNDMLQALAVSDRALSHSVPKGSNPAHARVFTLGVRALALARNVSGEMSAVAKFISASNHYGGEWYERVWRKVSGGTQGIIQPRITFKLPVTQTLETVPVIDRGASVQFASYMLKKPRNPGVSIASEMTATSALVSQEGLTVAAWTRHCIVRPVIDLESMLVVLKDFVNVEVVCSMTEHGFAAVGFWPLEKVADAYPSSVRKRIMLERAALTRTLGADPVESRNAKFPYTLGIFQKVEAAAKRERGIIAPDFSMRSVQKQVSGPIEHGLVVARDNWIQDPEAGSCRDHFVFMVKGLIPMAVGPYVSLVLERLYAGMRMYKYDNDFKTWDGLLRVEHLLAAYEMFLLYAVAEDAQFARELFTQLFYWVARSRSGIRVSNWGTMLSGIAVTSIVNGIINRAVCMVVHATLMLRVGVADWWVHVAHFVEGDDGLGFVDADVVDRFPGGQTGYGAAFVDCVSRMCGLQSEFNWIHQERFVQFCGMSVYEGPRYTGPVLASRTTEENSVQSCYDHTTHQPHCVCGMIRDYGGGCYVCDGGRTNAVLVRFAVDRVELGGCYHGATITGACYARLVGVQCAATMLPDANNAGYSTLLVAGSSNQWTKFLADLQLEQGGRVAFVSHASLSKYRPWWADAPRVDTLVFPRLVGDTCLYSVHNIDRVYAKITATCSGLPECPRHPIIDPACTGCMRAYTVAILMLRSRALCLLGTGASLYPMQKFCYVVCALTDKFVKFVSQKDRQKFVAMVNKPEHRRTLVNAGLVAADLFEPATHRSKRASVSWADSRGEYERQGLGVYYDATVDWVDRLRDFLRCVGPVPVSPIPAKVLPLESVISDAEAWIEFSEQWWWRVVEGIKSR